MNKISEQLLEAMDILLDQKASTYKFDRTIQATIFSVMNLDTGEYRVRYDGNIFLAYSSDLEKTYKEEDEVYVTVPEGDFSNRKLIISLADGSLTYNQLTSLQNTVFEASPPFDVLYNNIYDPAQEYGVVAGVDPEAELGHLYIYQGPDEYDPSGFHGLFQQYASQYEYIRIQASFLTQFHSQHVKGNYGLEVVFYTVDGSTVTYTLDINQFLGDPYSFSVFAPQQIILRTQKNILSGLKSIKLFQKDFEPDHYVADGLPTEEENLTDPNIFVTDVNIQYVDIKDLSTTDYYLTIQTPQGIVFTPQITSIDLVAQLIYKGENIMSEKNCINTWFKQDLSVLVGSADYDKNAGFGWRKIDKTGVTINIESTDVYHQERYKLVTEFQDSIFTAEIGLQNSANPHSMAIRQITNGEDVLLRLEGEEGLKGDWYVLYPDGTYLPLDSQQNSIYINAYLKYSSITFYCSVYDAQNHYIGVLSQQVQNSESADDLTISYSGEDTFRYDANGDITIEDSEKERNLQVILTWKEGFATAYTVEWYLQSGIDLINIPRDKDNALEVDSSMMDNIWVDNNNILHYNIRQKYKVNYTNNVFEVRIRTMAGDVYSFTKEILFLKDGDQGTNGTTYIASIRPCDGNGMKISGLCPLTYNILWGAPISLRCYVYKDGELINKDSSYAIRYDWSGINITLNGTPDRLPSSENDTVSVNGYKTIYPTSSSVDLQTYAKVTVSVTDTAHEGKQVQIYTTYPIDIAMNNIQYNLIDISSIPGYIKYTSSGQNPSFYSNDINYYYNQVPRNDLISSVNTNLLTIRTESSGKRYLVPASTYIFDKINSNTESSVAVLKFDSPFGSEMVLIHPIIMYLDNYGNEAINGWDGTALQTDESSYLFAPQVGAGTKDSANRFTGVVMGRDSGQRLVGLYGYQSGLNTFGLLQDGTAFFGARTGGGQININGKTATITGGDGGDSASGMTLNLADLRTSGTSSAIKVGGSVFQVLYNGALTATSANITGNIYAAGGQIGCDASHRGGWTITTNTISSGSGNGTVGLSSAAPFAFWAGRSSGGSAYDASLTPDKKISSAAPFVVTNDGFLHATNVYISGNISAQTGSIGGWTIGSNSLYSGSGSSRVGMASSGNGSYAFWAGNEDPASAPFSVTRSGNITANSGTFKGTVQTRSFKDLNNKDMMNSNGQFTANYLDVKGLNVNEKFKIDSQGNVTINGGSISWANVKDPSTNKTVSDLATDKVKDLAEGKFTNGTVKPYTFIDGTTISAPTVKGGKILAGQFMNLQGNNYITMGDSSSLYPQEIPSVVYFQHWYTGASSPDTTRPIFAMGLVYNDMESRYNWVLAPMSRVMLEYHPTARNSGTMYPVNTWDFSNATVRGITAVFA